MASSKRSTPQEEQKWFKSMGETITVLREQRDLSPTELAERAGLPVERLETIEAGAVAARWSELRHIAYALRTELPQMIQDSEMQQP
jgi:ribosome-binding protein aMBF1 (putative translation factor)